MALVSRETAEPRTREKTDIFGKTITLPMLMDYFT
jgi:hypothetical protein